MEGGGTSKGNNQLNQGDKIVLSIKSQDGDASFYRIQRDKKIQSLLLRYCKEKNLDYSAVSFICEGLRIKSTKTPAEIGLTDGDEIDAMVYQHGGGNIINPKSV